ncbi:hypothetical protein [Flavobacterium agrisoli]|uniref:HTH cro/C1-type domain-containing protein n=1 Tax=Flavobacterium agrisoli TaxID=2793066 RepID=A0A934UJF4_9FLAO|nr:hypothetical protein [Flavobacterium agrisoli]MBK0369524.1 hypothetical protein [Flavobacterium agrisoli]
MEKENVPQHDPNLSKKDLKELVYATDENGNYTTALSTGWEPKAIALSNAIDDIKERAEEAKLKVKRGEVSPICYYMELHKMDLSILAGYVEMWKWRVKRHFKPAVFAKLSDKTLQKYATAFDISLAELKNFKTD